MSGRRRCSQVGRSQTETDGARRPVTTVPSGLSVLLVAHRARGGQGGHVVLEGATQRLLRAQAGEGQMEDRLPHLAAYSLSLMGPAEPGTRLDRAHGAEVLCSQILHSDKSPVDEDAAGERPVIGRPVGPVSPHPLRDIPGPPERFSVGPGYEEGHRAPVVDPAVDELDQAGEIVLAQEAQLKARRGDDQAKQRPERCPSLIHYSSAWSNKAHPQSLAHPTGWALNLSRESTKRPRDPQGTIASTGLDHFRLSDMRSL
jgi:hypothetical protein